MDTGQKPDHEELDRIIDICTDHWKGRGEYHKPLWEFAKANPVFRDRFNIFNEMMVSGGPKVVSHELDNMARDQPREITSEWEFVLLYGYLLGVSDVVTDVEAVSRVPADDTTEDVDEP